MKTLGHNNISNEANSAKGCFEPITKEEDNFFNCPRMTKKFLLKECRSQKLYSTPYLNDVLYLQYKGLRKIENLEEYTGLKCLWLQSNGIYKIENLDKQENLRNLYLHNNAIEKIENLEHLTYLDTINLCHNAVKIIENLCKLPVLHTISLSHNMLSTADDIAHLKQCKSLSVVDLSYNQLKGPGILEVLTDIENLHVLNMMGNPFIRETRFYRKVITLGCINLTYLDDRPVFPKDRVCAEAWEKGGLEAEKEAHRKWMEAEHKKTHDSVMGLLRLRDERRAKKRREERMNENESEVSEERSGQNENTSEDLEVGINSLFDENKSATTDESLTGIKITEETSSCSTESVTQDRQNSHQGGTSPSNEGEFFTKKEWKRLMDDYVSRDLLIYEDAPETSQESEEIPSAILQDKNCQEEFEDDFDEEGESMKPQGIIMPWEVGNQYPSETKAPLIEVVSLEPPHSDFNEPEERMTFAGEKIDGIKNDGEKKEILLAEHPNNEKLNQKEIKDESIPCKPLAEIHSKEVHQDVNEKLIVSSLANEVNTCNVEHEKIGYITTLCQENNSSTALIEDALKLTQQQDIINANTKINKSSCSLPPDDEDKKTYIDDVKNLENIPTVSALDEENDHLTGNKIMEFNCNLDVNHNDNNDSKYEESDMSLETEEENMSTSHPGYHLPNIDVVNANFISEYKQIEKEEIRQDIIKKFSEVGLKIPEDITSGKITKNETVENATKLLERDTLSFAHEPLFDSLSIIKNMNDSISVSGNEDTSTDGINDSSIDSCIVAPRDKGYINDSLTDDTIEQGDTTHNEGYKVSLEESTDKCIKEGSPNFSNIILVDNKSLLSEYFTITGVERNSSQENVQTAATEMTFDTNKQMKPINPTSETNENKTMEGDEKNKTKTNQKPNIINVYHDNASISEMTASIQKDFAKDEDEKFYEILENANLFELFSSTTSTEISPCVRIALQLNDESEDSIRVYSREGSLSLQGDLTSKGDKMFDQILEDANLAELFSSNNFTSTDQSGISTSYVNNTPNDIFKVYLLDKISSMQEDETIIEDENLDKILETANLIELFSATNFIENTHNSSTALHNDYAPNNSFGACPEDARIYAAEKKENQATLTTTNSAISILRKEDSADLCKMGIDADSIEYFECSFETINKSHNAAEIQHEELSRVTTRQVGETDGKERYDYDEFVVTEGFNESSSFSESRLNFLDINSEATEVNKELSYNSTPFEREAPPEEQEEELQFIEQENESNDTLESESGILHGDDISNLSQECSMELTFEVGKEMVDTYFKPMVDYIPKTSLDSFTSLEINNGNMSAEEHTINDMSGENTLLQKPQFCDMNNGDEINVLTERDEHPVMNTDETSNSSQELLCHGVNHAKDATFHDTEDLLTQKPVRTTLTLQVAFTK
ncbi:uncharacterized protein LOC124157584 [Ischnura elegans]|uniref:uncharacterized protein LOC124157584 n=1 Tax=Ischnura elegans TaxID=197161 RepID=UPI001ED89F9D|nr:uncharacterized protein LOC124157584 [Ischnura elegans]